MRSDAADESAAANGDDDGFDVGNLFEEFKADGALAADHFGIVEGMDEGAAFFDTPAHGFVAGFVVGGAMKDDFSSIGAGGGNFDLRRGEGHDNLRADAALRSVESNSLRVVAGAGCDDSTLAFGFAQGEELVECAALFERSGALKVLELEMQTAVR